MTFEFVNVILNLSTNIGTITNLFFHVRNFLEKTERETENSLFFTTVFSFMLWFFKKFLRSQNRLATLPVALKRLKITFTNSNVNLLLFS